MISEQLDTCPKNDVISFSRKRFCALGLGVSGNTFSVKRPFGQVSYIPDTRVVPKILHTGVVPKILHTGVVLHIHRNKNSISEVLSSMYEKVKNFTKINKNCLKFNQQWALRYTKLGILCDHCAVLLVLCDHQSLCRTWTSERSGTCTLQWSNIALA